MYQLHVTIQKNKTHKNCLCVHLVNRRQPFSTQNVKAVSMTEPLFLFENENYLINSISAYITPRNNFSQRVLHTHTPYFICLLSFPEEEMDDDRVPTRYFKEIQTEILAIRQLLVINGIALHEENVLHISFYRPSSRFCC